MSQPNKHAIEAARKGFETGRKIQQEARFGVGENRAFSEYDLHAIIDAATADLQAQCAAMREALERVVSRMDRDGNPCQCGKCVYCGSTAALSSDAGRDFVRIEDVKPLLDWSGYRGLDGFRIARDNFYAKHSHLLK